MLPALFAVYPDARIVFTHRDPVDSVTSYASLTHLVRTMGTDHADRKEIAADWTGRLARAAHHALHVRESGDHPDAVFYDMRFTDFVKDQYREVQAIYEALGLPMSDGAAKRLRAFIDDHPKGKYGKHEYTPEEYGVDPAAVHEAFGEYLDHFGLRG